MVTSDHFDAVVVGSGFGGSVMAFRLAESGMSVCLLERGRRYPPDSFARNPREMSQSFWNPRQNRFGLLNFWSFRKLEVLSAAGLGGGSLIYANVHLRKDEEWFVDDELPDGSKVRWPISRADLDPHYDRIEKMLNLQRYPFDHSPYNLTPKSIAWKEAAEKLGLDFSFPPLAVNFTPRPGAAPAVGEPVHEDERNIHDRTRSTCRLCGECIMGCNYGSKNSMDFTYISAAARHGAEIRDSCEVKRFERREGGGWRVHYIKRDIAGFYEDRDTTSAQVEITADRLILSAGTMGTNYLMLRNRDALVDPSPRLGKQFSGNGDGITFLERASRQVNGKTVPRYLDSGYGPSVTTVIRSPDRSQGGPGVGFVLQDGGVPVPGNWVVQGLLAPSLATRGVKFAYRRYQKLKSPRSDVEEEVLGLINASDRGSRSVSMLGVGLERPLASIALRGDFMDIDWKLSKTGSVFDDQRKVMKQLAEAVGGVMKDSPLRMINRAITVHPMGGCPMGETAAEGVVDPWGQVHNNPGLYVVDAAVMPSSIGVNPAHTIMAFSDRAADKIIESRKTT